MQGNNVSCRLACATYGRVTCLTYQNKRACEQYNQQSSITHFDMNSTSESSILIDDFDALQYSICLAIGILLFVLILSIFIYLIRKKSSQFLFSCLNKSSNTKSSNRLSLISHQQFDSSDSRYTINDSYEPPPYPGSPLSSSLYRSDSIYYETIQTSSISNSMSMLNPMPLPEPNEFPNIRTHCV